MKKLILGSLVLLAACAQPILAETEQTLPAEAYTQMKGGGKLGKVWISPAFDGAKGFTVGKVYASSTVEDPRANTVDYFPYALRRISTPASTNVLSLAVVELSTVDRGSMGMFSATIGVEGKIVDKDGKLLVAFWTRERADNRETPEKNCEAVMDRIVWALSRDLGKAFQRALETREALVNGVNPSGLVPPAPVVPEPPLDMKGRLLRLDDLLKKGLITPEGSKAHKAEILAGL